MSHFVECQTEFRDPQALVAALIACGFTAEQIEIHAEAVPLYGYQGRTYPFTGFSIMNANKCSPGIPVFSGLFDVRLK